MRTAPNTATGFRRIGGRWRQSVLGVLAASLTLLEGCAILPSHIHNANDAAAAKTAQTEFAAYDTGAASVYQAMLTNLEKFKVEQDRVLGDLATNRDRALVTNAVINLAAADFTKQQEQLQEEVKTIDSKIQMGVEAYLKRKGEAIAQQADAKKAIERLNDAVEKAKLDADRWSQAIALINKGLAGGPATGTGASTAAAALFGRLDAVTSQTVQFRKADGTLGTTTIGAILKKSLDATGEDSKRLTALLKARGIDDTILTLGLDLAKAQRRAADVRLAQLSRRAQLYSDGHSAVRLAEALLKGHDAKWKGSLTDDLLAQSLIARRELAGFSEPRPAPADPADPYAYMKSFTGPLDTMTTRLVAVRRLHVADSILTRTDRLLTLAAARLDHEDSIVDSRAHDESWRALMRSGLAGLVAFHDGGFTAEDAANIIRIAQTIALAFIAGGAQ